MLEGRSHDERRAAIIRLAGAAGVQIRFCDRATMDKSAEGAVHQGCIGYATDFTYSSIDDIFELASSRGEKPFIVALDGIEDPHNFGSIVRTCECCGVHGVIIGKNRQVAVTDAVVRVAEGATEYVKIARVTNVNDAIRELKSRNVWVFALDMDGDDMYKTDLSGATALVVGAEGAGVSRLTKQLCDAVVSVPMFGKINSLNAGVAAALAVYRKKECDAQQSKK